MFADRGASNLVGFVIIFAIIITSVGAISTFGYDTLRDLRESEQLNNADRAFDLLDSSFDEIARGDATRRSGQVDLHGGSIRVANESILDVTVDGTGETHSIPVRALQYRLDDVTIAYQSGLTARSQDGGTAIRNEPAFTCDGQSAVVSVVKLTDPGDQIGAGTVGVVGQLNESYLLFPENRTGPESNSDAAADAVTVTVDSPYSKAWEAYFTDDENDWSETATDTYECSGVDRIFVRVTVIDVRFQR